MMGRKTEDQYPEKEATARFEAALRGGLSAPRKPLKDKKYIIAHHFGSEVETFFQQRKPVVMGPVKTAEQQAALMLAGIREQLVARRTQLSNAIRGYAAEFGVTAAKGLDKIEPLLAQITQDESLPPLARDLFAVQGREYTRLQVELKAIEAKLMAWHRGNADSRRLARDSGGRADRRRDAGDEDAGSACVHLRPTFCGLARVDPERPFHGRQDPARQDHPRRR